MEVLFDKQPEPLAERIVVRVHFSATQPSWFCPNGKPNEGEYSHAENDNRERGHLDDGKASQVKCHDALLGGIRATALIYVKRGGRARCPHERG